MPDIADVAWSEHDERNSEAVPNGWPTGAFPAYTDLVGQMMMGATKRFWNKINPVYQTSGTGDNYVVQTEIGIDQINLYEILCIRIDRSNTTPTPTLQFGATNARTIVKAGPSGYVPLAAGDMFAGNSHTFWYNGAFYVLTDPAISNLQPLSPNLTSWAAITRAAGFDTWVASPTSTNLAALVGDETGTGALVFGTGPTLSAPLLAGGTSGTTVLQASANASGTLTLPAATDTLVGRATTDTLSNKTFSDQPSVRNNLVVPTYVSSVSALQALNTTKDAVAVLTASGRGGTFIFNSANLSSQVTNDPQQGVYVAPSSAPTGASGAWVRQYTRLSVEYFGASTSATATANTTAIQAAVNFAQNYTGYLYFPALYSINGTILVSNNIVLEGVSAFTSGITTTTGAAISLVPSTLISNNNTWYGIRYLSIISTDVGAFYGLNYTSSGSEYLSNWETVGCYLSGTNGGALFDSTGSTVGIFSCTIRRNWFNNGITIKDGGDSITFTENTVNGNGVGLLVNGLKTGARQLVIRNNNFSALSECVYLLNVTGAFVDSNWMETPSYLGSYTGTTGSLMYAQACSNTQITRNTIQPLASVGGGFVPAAYAIRLNTSGSFNIISANQLIAIGGTGHIQIGGGVTNTYIDWNNNFDVTAVITDAGTGTFGAGSSPGIFKQLVSFQTATQFTSVIQALCTDTGTGNGPYYELYRNKAGGAAVNDGIGGFLWYGNNGSGTKTNLGYLTMTWTNVTAGSESGTFNIATYNAGSLTLAMTLGSTIALNRAATFSSYAAPLTNGGAALGQATLGWSNAFFSSGAALNFNNGNYTVTHSAGVLTFSGAVLSAGTGGVGYATGAGGTVTQATSRTTGVTLNKTSGAITMFTAAGSATPASFTVTNSTVAATDTIILNIKSGATNTYFYFVTAVAAGSFVVTFWTTGGTASDTPVINYNVIKGVAA